MQPTTSEDRRKELRNLVERIEAHPEAAMNEERGRVRVLREMLQQEAEA